MNFDLKWDWPGHPDTSTDLAERPHQHLIGILKHRQCCSCQCDDCDASQQSETLDSSTAET